MRVTCCSLFSLSSRCSLSDRLATNRAARCSSILYLSLSPYFSGAPCSISLYGDRCVCGKYAQIVHKYRTNFAKFFRSAISITLQFASWCYVMRLHFALVEGFLQLAHAVAVACCGDKIEALGGRLHLLASLGNLILKRCACAILRYGLGG